LSERQYRTAKQFLAKFNFATFKATTKGTIATIINTRVFDVNLEASDGQTDRQPTDGRRRGDGRATTNKNVKNVKTEKNGKKDPAQSAASLSDSKPAHKKQIHASENLTASDHERFTDEWCRKYPEYHDGTTYGPTGADVRELKKRLAAGMAVDKMFTLMNYAWEQTDKNTHWNCVNKSATIQDFVLNVMAIENELRLAKKREDQLYGNTR
jgi:hypothetical protein